MKVLGKPHIILRRWKQFVSFDCVVCPHRHQGEKITDKEAGQNAIGAECQAKHKRTEHRVDQERKKRHDLHISCAVYRLQVADPRTYKAVQQCLQTNDAHSEHRHIQQISLLGDVQPGNGACEQEEQQADRSAEDGTIAVYALAGLADTLVVHLAKKNTHQQSGGVCQTDGEEL